MHCAESVAFNRPVAAFNGACFGAWHRGGVRLSLEVSGACWLAATGRQHEQHRAVAAAVGVADRGNGVLLVGAEGDGHGAASSINIK